MKIFILLLTVLPAAAISIGACSSDGPNPPTRTVSGNYTDISVARLDSMLSAKDFLLVNVHIPYEGEIKQTDLFIPYDRVEDNLTKLPANKQSKIVVYCLSGRMSAIAARALVELGYTDIYNLPGGMEAWKAQGHQIILNPQ